MQLSSNPMYTRSFLSYVYIKIFKQKKKQLKNYNSDAQPCVMALIISKRNKLKQKKLLINNKGKTAINLELNILARKTSTYLAKFFVEYNNVYEYYVSVNQCAIITKLYITYKFRELLAFDTCYWS